VKVADKPTILAKRAAFAVVSFAEVSCWNFIFASAYVVYSSFLSSVNPITSLTWMMMFAAATAFAAHAKSRGTLVGLRDANPVTLLLHTASSSGGFLVLFILLSREGPVSVLVLILLVPLVNVFFASRIFGDGVTSWIRWAVGFVLCVSGTALFRITAQGSGKVTVEILVAVYAIFSTCSSISRSALTRGGTSTASITFVSYFITSIVAGSVMIASGHPALPSGSQITALAYLGIVPTAAAAIGYQASLNRLGYPVTEAVGMSKPLFGYLCTLLLAALGIASPPLVLSTSQIAGASAAILGAVICASLSQPPTNKFDSPAKPQEGLGYA
jgi:drug/metabolite transporter (DMT)-like permease